MPTGPSYAPHQVTHHVSRMRDAALERDAAMSKVRLVRDGKFSDVWPDQFSEKYPTAIVANFVDVAARDLAANLAPLPALACASGNMRTDADKRRAEKKNRIGSHYWRVSDLEYHLKTGCDQYFTYGFLPFYVEPDFDRKSPRIVVEDPEGAYYDLDRRMNVRRYAKVTRWSIEDLCAQYPELENTIRYNQFGQPFKGVDTEVIRYVDDTWVIVYLPERNNTVVTSYQHGMKDDRGRPIAPVHIAIRPGLHLNPRGQFDDVLYVQLAHAVFAALTLEAAHKSVQAPLAVPSDINELQIGPDALLVTDNPEKVQRVPLQVPQSAFVMGEQLQEEMKEGAGYPDSRLGNVTSSAITGRGISALEGGFDSQIKNAQDVIKLALIKATELCFRMDVLLWGRTTKTINGTISGESFELTYTPRKDIGDNYSCDVSYGFAAGTSPNSAIVTLLQLQGGGIIGKDTFRRQLPFDVDIDQVQRELDIELLNGAILQGIAAGLQATGQMIAQGMEPQAAQYFQAAAQIIQGRREGKDLAALALAAFPPPEPQPEAPPGVPGAPDAGAAGDQLPGVGANGLPTGVAPGQAGMAPGGRPSVTDLTAGFTGSGAPAMNAQIYRRVPTG